MKRITINSTIFLFMIFVVYGQQSAVVPQTFQQSEIPTVTYCDLVRDKDNYKDKTVRLRAVYRFGFEWSEVYCFECQEGGGTWLDFENELCDGSKKIKGDHKTVKVQVIGKFISGGGYGHMGAYRNKFVVGCVEKAKTISSNDSIPSALPANIREKTRCCNSDF